MNRLMQIVFPEEPDSATMEVLAEHDIVLPPTRSGALWQAQLIVPAEVAESLTDRLEQRFASDEKFRVILLPIEAVLPRPKEEAPADEQEKAEQPVAERVSREELYADMVEGVRTGRVFLLMVVLSTIVAAVGLLRDNVAVIIGAMVIAPLLGPNMALALATTLGDSSLARQAMAANFKGISLSVALSLAIGLAVNVDVTIPEIAARTQLQLSDLVLALAAGAAGTFAFTGGASASVIGVMVAVALMPPLVTAGMLFGSGQLSAGLSALTLMGANVICVNLAGVATFLAQGVGPRTWWESEKARRHSRRAGLIWLGLLVALVILLLLR